MKTFSVVIVGEPAPKMWWTICLLWFARFTIVDSIEVSSVIVDELKATLQNVAIDEYRMYMDEMAKPPTPPMFEPPGAFMRSYLSGTGVGNREELLIKGIEEIHVFNDEDFSMWSYKRFNNSDYVLAANRKSVILNVVDFPSEEYLEFSKEEAVFTHRADEWSTVIDVNLFTRLDKRSVVLFAAILSENAGNTRLHLYEIIRDTGAPATLIDLGIKQSARKVSFVQSLYGGSLVVLIDSPGASKLVYQRKGSNELSHYVEVYYPNAVDLVTFTVHGHGYIAVASATTCDVFKMDEFAREELVFDSLSVYNQVVDLEYFRLGFHHYLAVASERALQLFVWKSGEFALKQTIFSSQGAVRGLYSVTLPTCRDDVVLFLLKDEAPELYVYSGREDSFVMAKADIPITLRMRPGSITSFTRKNKAMLLFEDSTGVLMAFVIETYLEHVANPVVETGLEVSKQMQIIQDMMKDQEKQLDDIRIVLDNAVRRTGDQVIGAYQVFNEISTQETTIVNEVKDPIFVQWEGSSLTLQEYKEGTKRLEENILDLEKIIKEIEAKISDVVRVDEDAVITGTKRFLGDVSGTSILARSVNLEHVAGIDMRQLQKDIYRLDKPQKINGTLTFTKPLTIEGDLDIDGTLNGLDISSDVMTTNTAQTSYAEMTFENDLTITGDLQVSGKINDIKIRDEVVTLAGTHHISGKKIFGNGIAAENVQVGLLNGKNLNEVYEGAFRKSGPQTIGGTKTFKGGLVTGDIILKGTLNGYNLTELANDVVRKDRVSTITGTKTFTDDVTITGDLRVSGLTNGLRIPDDLLLADVEQTVTGEKTFTATVTANTVFVSGTVDGLHLPADVVTLSGDEEVPSTIFFTEGIAVENDVTVRGLVDGVDLSLFEKEAIRANATHEFQDAIFMGDVTVLDELLVLGKVNGVDLDELAKDVVFKGDTDIVVTSEKRFKKVVADTIQLGGTINGYDLSKDFMTVRGDQFIRGTKTFKGHVVLNNVEIADGLIGGLNVNKLYEKRISLIIAEDEIERDFEFSDHVVVQDLRVRGTIGGLRIPGDVVLRSSKDPIANKVFKNTVEVHKLVVDGDADVTGLFGGLNLLEFFDNRITLKGDQEIEGDVWIANSSIGGLEISGLVNGVDIVKFARNVMSKTKDQTVTGAKEFLGDTTVYGPITTEKGINGVDLAELNNRAFKLKGPQPNNVVVPMHFVDMTVNDIQANLVNGVNLTELDSDSLKKTLHNHQHVPGTTVLQGDLHVEGDIDADEVNGLNIPRDVLLKSVPQTITGTYTLGNMGVTGDVTVDGLVNGMKLSEIAPKLVQNGQEVVIESNVTFIGHVYVLQDLEVTGRVNDVDLKDILNNVLLKKGDQEIKGHKTIKGDVTIRGDFDVANVNGINWSSFLADVVRTNVPQTIQGLRTFVNDVEATKVEALEAKANLVNGKNLTMFLDNVVYTDVPAEITGIKTFTSTVVISEDLNAELINGLNLKRDVITLICSDKDPMGVQVITGQKTFGSLKTAADIIVNGTVNSYDLYDLYSDTLFIEGDQYVRGHKTLLEEVEFKSNVNPVTVNGMVLREDLVTLDTKQDIHGPMIFMGDLTLQDVQVDGLVNYIDIADLAQNAVYLDTDDAVNGQYSLDSVVSLGDVGVSDVVNDLELPAFDRDVSAFWEAANATVAVIEREADENCELVHNLQDILARSYYALEGFSFHQEVNLAATFIRTEAPDEFTFVDYDVTAAMAAAVAVRWEEGQFLLADKTDTEFRKSLNRNVGASEVSLKVGILSKNSILLVNGFPLDEFNLGFDEADICVNGPNTFTAALLLKAKGVVEIREITISHHPETVQVTSYEPITVGKGATAVSIFQANGAMFLAVSRQLSREPCKVFRKGDEGGWQKLAGITSHSSPALAHFLYHGYHYLVFASVAPFHETHEHMSLQVYRISGPRFTFFQKIPFDNALGLDVFSFGDLGEIHLAAWNDTVVQVFRLQGESGFEACSIIHGKCVKDVKALPIGDGIYLAVAKQSRENDLDVASVIYKGLVKGTKYVPKTLEYC